MTTTSSEDTNLASEIVGLHEVTPPDSSKTTGGVECIPRPPTPDEHSDQDDDSCHDTSSKRTCLRRHYGSLFGVSSALAYGLQSLFMKVSTDTIYPPLLVVLMSPTMMIGSLVCLIHGGVPLPRDREHYTWLLLTGIAISAYGLLFTFALSHASAGDVVTITYTSVILIAILGWAMLGETFGLVDAIMAAITLIGVVFVSRPPFIFGLGQDSNDEYQSTLKGLGLALATSLVITFIMTSMRKHAVLGINAFCTMFTNGLLLFTTAAILCTVTGSWHCLTRTQWATSQAAGICYFLAQTMCLYALKHEDAMIVNILLTLEIIFAFLLQFTLLGTSPPWTSYVGSMLIILACIGITVNRGLKKANRNPS